MIKKFFEKHELFVCITLIVSYIVVNSLCMQNWGVADHRSTVINTLFSLGLLCLIFALKGVEYYGFKGVKDLKNYLYFIPLLLLISVNLWEGIHVQNTKTEILFHILTMLNVGFIEEIVFRGFLFRMMEKDNVKIAILVNALTFGIGHILNLLNGAEILPTLLQIGGATSIGFLFVTIFYKSGSILPCMITHSLINALSIFRGSNEIVFYLSSIVLMVIPALYAVYIYWRCKKSTK